ncbi:MAG: patatin-like phospholipase family protein [Candidatus Bipolaricaulota bacterium]|nr:patatin-like phospholipase family protein [Candidatus Bipolaricaulota bacterium]
MRDLKGLGLALGGGGARGFAHFGVLLELLEAGVEPAYVAGTSMGAVAGAAYAVGQEIPKVVRLLAHLDLTKIFGVPETYDRVLTQTLAESLWERLRGRAWWEEGSPRLSRLLELLRLLSKGRWFEDLEVPFVAVAADLATGEEVRIDEGALHLGVAASAAVPGLFGPVRWRKRYLVDGGLVNNLPVDAVADLGARTVLAVDVSAPLGPLPRTLVGVALRGYEITAGELLRVKLAAARARLGPRLLVLHPDVDSIGLLEFGRIEEAVEAGRESARAALSRL